VLKIDHGSKWLQKSVKKFSEFQGHESLLNELFQAHKRKSIFFRAIRLYVIYTWSYLTRYRNDAHQKRLQPKHGSPLHNIVGTLLTRSCSRPHVGTNTW